MKVLRKSRLERIEDKLRRLRSRRARNHFITHIGYPSKQKEIDQSGIASYTTRVEAILPKIKELIKSYRKYTPNIWDQTKFSASFLLICKAYGNLQSLVSLAKNGSNHELVEISRSAVESLDLANLFLEDEKGKLLKNWFKGKIIGNKESRKVMNAQVNEINKSGVSVPLEDVKNDVYETYSLYTHSSYSALLDSVDPYYENYDFKKYAGYHFSAKNLELIENIIINILLSLKDGFIRAGDPINFDETDNLMKAIGYKNLSQESIDNILKDYKQQKQSR